MPITIQPYTPTLEPAVAQFNQRLSERDVTFRFPESSKPRWLPNRENRRIYQEMYLAVENDQVVRGGYILKHQDFRLGEHVHSIGNYQLPLSEGIIDKKYGIVGLHLLNDAVKRQPLLYALGMGGLSKPLPQLLASMRWVLHPVPFYFKVCHPYRFLRNIAFLRTSPIRRICLDLAAKTGIGWLGLRLMQRPGRKPTGMSCEPFESFGQWADDLWENCRYNLSLSAVRDQTTLNILYPASDMRFIRLKVSEGRRLIGWVVLLNTAMTGHKQFGDLKVGTIVDCLGVSGGEWTIMHKAAEYLRGVGTDLIVSNQMHQTYGLALGDCGFLEGPSNFILAVSPMLAEKLESSSDIPPEMHINRGDGDGPIHL